MAIVWFAPLCALGFCALGLWSCGGVDAETGARPRGDARPATAQWDMTEQLLERRGAKRSPSDGAGTARIASGPALVQAASWHDWRVAFEVGEHGVAAGGSIVFATGPGKGWSAPQDGRSTLPGYTTAAFALTGRPIRTRTLDVEGGAGLALEPGPEGFAPHQTIVVHYGSGTKGSQVARAAGTAPRFQFFVDGDGDGVRAAVDVQRSTGSAVTVRVVAGPADRAVLLGPSIARPGEDVVFHLSILDAWANRARAPAGLSVRISGAPADWSAPASLSMPESGFIAIPVRVGDARSESARLVATLSPADSAPGLEQIVATSNPMFVDAAAPRIAWADLHGHSSRAGGAGSAVEFFAYARDTARLDLAALTDPAEVARIGESAPMGAEVIALQGFIPLHGYEWNSWVHGHRSVLFFGEAQAALSPLDARGDTPSKLWRSLRGTASLTIARHSAGDPVPINWSFVPPASIEPVTEIVSPKGSSEWSRRASSAGLPALAGGVAGQYVRDQLDLGVRLGFVGFGDADSGHPGLAHLAPAVGGDANVATSGGLTGFFFEGQLTRDAALEALQARRVFATSGPRMATISDRTQAAVTFRLAGTAPITRAVQVIGPVRADAGIENAGSFERMITLPANVDDTHLTLDLKCLEARAYTYVRVEQADGAAGWFGPFW